MTTFTRLGGLAAGEALICMRPMAHHDASSAECLVFAFKDGVLSKLGHDLKLRVGRFSMDVADDASSVSATFDLASLEVVCARANGADAPGALSRGDLTKIHANLYKDVLEVKKHPEARFTSSRVTRDGEAYRVEGALRLHGTERPLSATLRPEGDRLVAEVELHQPDFGIEPFRAPLGVLKVKPSVTVRVAAPKP